MVRGTHLWSHLSHRYPVRLSSGIVTISWYVMVIMLLIYHLTCQDIHSKLCIRCIAWSAVVMDERQQRGLVIAAKSKITRKRDTWVVPS